MSISSLRWFGIFATLITLVLAVGAALHASMNPAQKHMSGGACSDCHMAGNGVNKENAHQLMATQEKLCASCHPKAIQVSHPSGIRPTFAVSAAYPLDWKGDMTCSTCHQVHGDTPGLMRGDAHGRDLCLSCHDNKFFDRMADQGISMISSGHMSSETAKVDLRGLGVDAFSIQCMGCHGTFGDQQGATIDSNLILRHAGNSVNHPIGRRYSESSKMGGYKPEAVVSQRLFLPDGMVSCVSCHQGYTKEHGKLRVGNQGSALCFECHDL